MGDVTAQEGLPSRDAVDILTHEHRRIEQLFVDLAALPPADPQLRELAVRAGDALTRHAALERTHLGPMAARLSVDRGMAELPAGELEPLLEELTDASVDSARFAELVGELQKLFDRHVQRQQTKFFPELRAVLPEDDLVSLGQRMSQPPS